MNIVRDGGEHHSKKTKAKLISQVYWMLGKCFVFYQTNCNICDNTHSIYLCMCLNSKDKGGDTDQRSNIINATVNFTLKTFFWRDMKTADLRNNRFQMIC